MADPWDVVSFDGHDLGAGTAIIAEFDWRDDWSTSVTINTIAQRNAAPIVDSVSPDPVLRLLRLSYDGTSGTSEAVYHALVNEWFRIAASDDDLRTLTCVAWDGMTEIEL